MRSETPQRIAVIGGGLTGAALVIHATRASSGPLVFEMIEPSAEIGRGLAYGSTDPSHRINVPSDKMSLFPETPDHLTRWLFDRGILPDQDSTDRNGHFYVPRSAYGDYAAETLRQSLSASDGRTRLNHHQALATRFDALGTGWRITLSNGRTIEADAVMLCCGHAAPSAPRGVADEVRHHPGFIGNPWARDALGDVETEDSVLIVGTGLTMADVVASLDRRGHRGAITAVSRRGLLARPQGLFLSDIDFLDGHALPATALELLRLARRRVRDLGPATGWQPVMDALRFTLRRMWPALPPAEQRKIARKLLPFWEVHRFRVAPQPHEIVVREMDRGRLRLRKAGLRGLDLVEGRLAATLKPPGATSGIACFDRVVLCTGPGNRLRHDPLLASLIAQGLARADAVGNGLAVDGESRVLAPDGTAQERFRALGPITRGSFGEMTGAPDIIAHVQTIAPGIVQSLEDRRGTRLSA